MLMISYSSPAPDELLELDAGSVSELLELDPDDEDPDELEDEPSTGQTHRSSSGLSMFCVISHLRFLAHPIEPETAVRNPSVSS